MSKDRAFELFLENYSSFILAIERKEEFTLQGALSGQDCKETAGKYVFLHMSVLSFIFNKKLLL